MDVSHWRNLASVETEYGALAGISEGGELLIPWAQEMWTDGNFFWFKTFGDFQPSEDMKKLDFTDFTDLTALEIWSPGAFVFGLKQDGTLVMQPENADGLPYAPAGFPDLSQWRNIKKLYSYNTVLAGIREDGTAVCWSPISKSWDVGSWENVVDIFCIRAEGNEGLIGLLEDGTFVGTEGIQIRDLQQLTEQYPG